MSQKTPRHWRPDQRPLVIQVAEFVQHPPKESDEIRLRARRFAVGARAMAGYSWFQESRTDWTIISAALDRVARRGALAATQTADFRRAIDTIHAILESRTSQFAPTEPGALLRNYAAETLRLMASSTAEQCAAVREAMTRPHHVRFTHAVAERIQRLIEVLISAAENAGLGRDWELLTRFAAGPASLSRADGARLIAIIRRLESSADLNRAKPADGRTDIDGEKTASSGQQIDSRPHGTAGDGVQLSAPAVGRSEFTPGEWHDPESGTRYDFGRKRLLWEIWHAIRMARRKRTIDEFMDEIPTWKDKGIEEVTVRKGLANLREFWRNNKRKDIADRIVMEAGYVCSYRR